MKYNGLGSGTATNCRVPLDPAYATEIGVPPYTLTGKGRFTSVVQSSQWLPISLPPAVIVAAVVAVVYVLQVGLGVGLGVGALAQKISIEFSGVIPSLA